MSALVDQLVQVEFAAHYGICIAGTVMAYDYLLTVQQERNFVWKSRWTYGKALFLLLRYTGPLVIIGFFFLDFGGIESRLPCAVILYLVLIGALVSLICSGLILALRTWALWNRSLIFGWIIGTTWASMTVLIVTFSCLAMTTVSPYDSQGSPALAGCGALSTSATAAADIKLFLCLAVYEGLIVLLTLARGLRYLYDRTPLMSVLYRDAFIVSTCLCAFTIAVAILSSSGSTQFYLPYEISISLYFVTPCRIILNLREATMSVDEWDLATTRVQPMVDEDALSSSWSE